MNIWFSSDFHINHGNISGKKSSNWSGGYRIFDSVDEMNKTIFNTINKYVKPEDILYFLGDFCFGGHSLTPQWRTHIACQTIHVCRGNHDIKIVGNTINYIIDLYKDSFTSIQDRLEVKHGQHRFFLDHYPHLSWHHASKGVIMLHGHEHGNLDHLNTNVRRLDVGIDSAYKFFKEYRPFSIEEVISIVENKSPLMLGHHLKI